MSTRDRLYDKRVTLYVPVRRWDPLYGDLLAHATGGYTYVEQNGAWKDLHTGKLHEEPVLVITALYSSVVNWRVSSVLEDIRKDLLQRGEKEVLMVNEAVSGVGYS